jgi:hypothetical protein
VNANHGPIAKIFEEKVNNLSRGKEEIQPLKKEVKFVWKLCLQFLCYERALQK